MLCINSDLKSFDRRSSSLDQSVAVTRDIYVTGTTNASFVTELCIPLIDGFAGDLSVRRQAACTKLFLVPDCFYGMNLTGITSFTLSCVILRGNATYPDPMIRLATSMPSISNTGSSSRLVFTTVAFTSSSVALTTVDWTTVFNMWPQLQYFYLVGARMATFSLPPTLPTSLYSFTAQKCGLTGTIPATLFAGNTAAKQMLSLIVSQNSLNGLIPANLFSDVDFSMLNSLSVDLSFNQLSGTVPTQLFNRVYPNLGTFGLDVSSNSLTGPIASIFDTAVFNGSVLTRWIFTADDNQFTGPFPGTWFSYNTMSSSFQMLEISASNNLLSGPLPTAWLPNLINTAGATVTLNLANNSLYGDISASFFDASASVLIWQVNLNQNAINGTINANCFKPLQLTTTAGATFDFSENQITGNLPSYLMGTTASNTAGTLIFNFANNPKLTGTIPSSMLSSLLTVTPSTLTNNRLISITLDNTGLTGALNFPAGFASLLPPIRLSFSAINASFLSLNIQDGQAIETLDLTNNTRLSGSLPSFIFENTSLLIELSASGTSLSGTMPNMGLLNPSAITRLELSNTGIDFCGGSRANWTSSSLNQCQLLATSASSCQYTYPTQCSISAPSCQISTRPAANWVCVSGIWTLVAGASDSSTTVLVIPSGASEAVIIGNVSANSIIINGLGASLTVQQGCASNLSSVTLQFTLAELEELGTLKQLLISLDPDANCSSLDHVQVNLQVKGETCKKANLQTETSSGGSQLSALLSINDSGCRRTWWIILVSVICGVIVLLLIIFVLLVTFVPSVKAFVRPYSNRKKSAGV